MQIFTTIDAYRAWRKALSPDICLGFVPTMGALHEGHASLVARAAQQNEEVVVSIFVNPTQFGPKEDFSKYPRTLEEDIEKVKAAGGTAVFAPLTSEIYSDQPAQIQFSVRDMDKILCGKSRLGHFNGVVQVVSLLFHIIQPDSAYFGKKDYQQFRILSQLVKEQHFPIQMVGCPIVREPDGLAMSSRNRYLSPIARQQAAGIYQLLLFLRKEYTHYQDVKDLIAAGRDFLLNHPQHHLMSFDYLEILEQDSLSPVPYPLSNAQKPHAFVAVYCDGTRLIDNFYLGEE